MIKAVKIQNFKNILDQRIELERFTVFVGANGSGKTSVLEAVEWAVHADKINPQRTYSRSHAPDWIYSRGGSGDLIINCETGNGDFTIQVTPPDHVEVPPDPWRQQLWKYSLSGSEGTAFDQAQKDARPLVYLRLNAARLAEPSYSDTTRPRISPDGGGAASVLAFMALNDPDAFDEFMDHVRGLLPQIKRIRFRKVPVLRSEIESITIGNDSGERQTHRTFQGEAILFDFHNAKDIAADTASEGTLMILGLLTVLLGPDRPKTLLLDDIEHGLHPLAQKQLVMVIGRIMERLPDLQVIATAHSPYLLNYLSPEQVRIMAADAEGHARCGRLIDHPKFATWKDEMAPGEMWSLFGEKWLAGLEAAK